MNNNKDKEVQKDLPSVIILKREDIPILAAEIAKAINLNPPPEPEAPEEKYITRKQAREILGNITPQTFWLWQNRGILKPHHTIKKTIYYSKADVKKLAKTDE